MPYTATCQTFLPILHKEFMRSVCTAEGFEGRGNVGLKRGNMSCGNFSSDGKNKGGIRKTLGPTAIIKSSEELKGLCKRH